ncbi:MAG: hydrogenase maturation nickel metallochaperone HypA [Anaerolineae bacterium]|nr:hydrogenase maturation nickel metallochaperone HypA [Anaerolineae bacterium]
MHELGVTQSLLEIATRHAEQAGATRITRLSLVVGELTSIVDDSVQFYWDLIAAGTLAEGAMLEFRRVPATLRCANCAHEFPLSHDRYVCPRCESSRITVAGGEEFYLESIDVDLPAPV